MIGGIRFSNSLDVTCVRRVGGLIPHLALTVIAIIAISSTCKFGWSQEPSPPFSATSPKIDHAIKQAFVESHNGWSVDEVLLDDARRNAFLKSCRSQTDGNTSDLSDKQIFVRLIQLRKGGKLDIKSTQRTHSNLDAYLPIAEIASRLMMDQHNANVDQWLVDPALLRQFDDMVQEIAPDSSAYDVRKAALKLRKSRRLQPELLARVTDWKREIRIMSVEQATASLNDLPKNAGVYIFRDVSGFLYIGQSNNLRTRLTKHLDQSDRKSLCNYLHSKNAKDITLELHIFAKDSPAADTVVREAYESDLIRTRKPRLNIAP